MTRYTARPDPTGRWSMALPVEPDPPAPPVGLLRRTWRRLTASPEPPGGWSGHHRVDQQCTRCELWLTVLDRSQRGAVDRAQRWMLGHRDSVVCREALLARRMTGVAPTPVCLTADGQQHTGRAPHVVQPEPGEPGLDLLRRRMR